MPAGGGGHRALHGPARLARRGDTFPQLIDPDEDPQIVREQLERAARVRGLTVQFVKRIGDRLIIQLQALVEQMEEEGEGEAGP